MRWICYLTKNRENHTSDCKHLTKNARQSFFGHPCLLSLNPLRESIQLLLLKKRDIRRSTQNIIALVKSLLFSNLRVGQKKMHSFGGRPRERIQILLWFIQSSLSSKLWVRCFCLGYSNILFLWWPFPDIPNEGDWWVRDSLLPSFSERRGLLGFKLFCFLTACSRLNQSEGLLASIQWKARLASVFTTL